MTQQSLYNAHPFLAARLGTREILRRQHGANTEDALMCVKNYDYRGEFALHEEDAEELSRRLKVDMSIILFNAGKLRGNCYGLMAYYQAFRRNILQKKDVASRESPLNSKTMAIALEFYLQMDGESSHTWIFMLKIAISRAFLSPSGHILYENVLIPRSAASIGSRRPIL